MEVLEPVLTETSTAVTSSENYESALAEFLERCPEYAATASLDELRERDFARLDANGSVYLDFTGGGLYGASLIEQHSRELINGLYGNPHSTNPSSQASTVRTEGARRYVLKYFNAAPDEYACVFTANASGALKLVGESYPFAPGAHFLLTFDNHNSVNGIREFARHKGATFNYSPIRSEDLRFDEEALSRNLLQRVAGKNKLFGFPAQSNVSGAKHDLEWINRAQALGWDVLLDAAAFVPSNRLDLSKYKPEFVAISFYKMFGYPTGIGALLIKKNVIPKLQRPWFAGGTVTVSSVRGDGYYYGADEVRFEEGTINYLEIPAVENGLRYLEAIGIEKISARIHALTVWLLKELLALRHSNGRNVVRVYGPQDAEKRGGSIAVNFFDQDGEMHEFYEVEEKANQSNISLRSGCFCNPGIDETNHALPQDDLWNYFHSDGAKDYFGHIATSGRRRGAVRMSLGYVSNFADVWSALNFARSYVDSTRVASAMPMGSPCHPTFRDM